ncbi:ATP-binding cassette domain-containing protein [Streptococcus macedonicus]|uniref:ATP-binding cassette domain-containing protein n=1 Tax=Streptococcus macedonicus TaxID=59310 RepID=A0AA47FEA0_STRMC|nr:ATP-binding cassette domain-containing protein [Streptococcus macedonicus]MCW8486436.1 ATP-binding cassette domain-containing protein [Streptococcus macedonicus]MCW8494597.1 ATP-binding cassette domain-containing protein [Streptococcus macedonicus]MCW8499918.1 ATP-binding cassette domain-containing protein [Streptococcus macedonicus]MCW8501893.1 ATP-binding cassette domain-containing protein [Streptococcus macedonicus]MCW8504045.1 ATP-binding cassette domain-containing protein [Streptococcu
MLKIKNFTLTYDEPVLENVNLSFKSGEITVLTGTSGSGKSSLLKVIKMVLFHIFNQLNYQVKLLIKVKVCLIWLLH